MVRHFLIVFLISLTVYSVVKCELYRLPNNVKPVRYILQLEPNLTFHSMFERKPSPFYGSIIMELKVIENTRNISFHVNNLEIDKTSIKLTDTNNNDIEVAKTSSNTDNELYTVELEKDVVKGEFYNLTIGDFSGVLGYSEGFFLARYWKEKSDDEPKGLVAVTHFEPTGARKAFPCFDEPALKAKFLISLIRPEGYVSLSNEDLEYTEDLGNGRFKDTFKETPVMPSFTVAFTVSDFLSTEKLERHRIFAKPKSIKKGDLDYALKTSVKTLQLLEEFTGINFTLDKMDSFAVPQGYFQEHAMENWGLVIYGEEHLTYSNTSSAFTLKRITTYISHEFAHQWFGNLVTPEWWDYLWLSESFAAYFQYYIASSVQPTWRLMDQFLLDRVINSFHEEEFSHGGSHSLNYRIQRSGQYPPFHIMYQKGCSIVRMMSHFLSQDVFKKGLRMYLENKKFSTAVPSDLYNALQKAVDKASTNNLLENLTVAEILGTWDTLTGFPIVTVTRDYKTGAITVVQSTKFNDSETEKLWKIPVNYAFSADPKSDFEKTTADFWLTGKSRTVNKNFPSEGWLLVNKQQTGYYRVNYDTENWERIIKVLKSDQFRSIHVLQRAQLINDAFYLAYHDEIPVSIPMRLSEYLIQEKDYIPWGAFYNGLSSYFKIYTGRGRDVEIEYFKNHPLNQTITPPEEHGYTQEYKTFQQYIRALTKNLRDYLGDEEKPDESILDTINREEVDRFFPWYFRDEENSDYKRLLSFLQQKSTD